MTAAMLLYQLMSALPAIALAHTSLGAWAQGIELENPHAKQDDQAGGTESYFSEYSGFRSLKKPPSAP